ncbi:hypothetical protein ACFLS1_06165 [Verrucomicrobiota bacterium]
MDKREVKGRGNRKYGIRAATSEVTGNPLLVYVEKDVRRNRDGAGQQGRPV